ncbi:hypothetical protein ACH5RR_008838 [Cinchona calisaya]|uniref:Uncharacterized protein n=1 Tax=Cinchona calisaya TaxID=153742 RepID=A0ABD3ACG3_9GENT
MPYKRKRSNAFELPSGLLGICEEFCWAYFIDEELACVEYKFEILLEKVELYGFICESRIWALSFYGEGGEFRFVKISHFMRICNAIQVKVGFVEYALYLLFYPTPIG